MDTKRVNIINFYELPEEWQAEAISNLGDIAYETSYIKPSVNSNPVEHVLQDLNECYPIKNRRYNGAISISNNSVMCLRFNDDMSEAVAWYV